MSNREFEYHPEAIVEARKAFYWYLDRSELAADGFWGELRRARQSATEQPETWGKYLHGTHCFRLNRFPYVLVYVERGDRIVGIAVAHLHRRPGYWKSRLAR